MGRGRREEKREERWTISWGEWKRRGREDEQLEWKRSEERKKGAGILNMSRREEREGGWGRRLTVG